MIFPLRVYCILVQCLIVVESEIEKSREKEKEVPFYVVSRALCCMLSPSVHVHHVRARTWYNKMYFSTLLALYAYAKSKRAYITR
jgi:hypothetical protein